MPVDLSLFNFTFNSTRCIRNMARGGIGTAERQLSTPHGALGTELGYDKGLDFDLTFNSTRCIRNLNGLLGEFQIEDNFQLHTVH